MSVYFILTVVYFYMIYYTGFDLVVEMIREQPVQVNWASRRHQLTRGVNVWLTEALFDN